MRDCPVCSGPLTEDVGPDDDGEVEYVLRCANASCAKEFADCGEPWTLTEIVRAVRQVVAAQRWGEM